ncbi:Predicted arabinose efflux permease, MFS family [Duganella sacchari]|uniref:Predicted arabinose efflux permease, MFS family n=1 Tax=Duganella sacchari TaxID=551987 RepID=A0A1M7RBR6_9BURK|nr:MFS transporter [Duganella sacchari]SHN43579.1 Predicted arabinose efflux permease, MFS family [Duganella sacchari]
MHRAWHTIGILAFTQIASWGSLYYAFSIVAPGIGRELGMRAELVYGAFSWSLLVAGLVATPTGMLLDRFGGKLIMATGSLVCGAGLIWLSRATGTLSYFGASTVLGVAMSLTLYEAAFATINRKFNHNSRQAISTLTLFAGFASTVFWPLTLKLSTAIGWRETYFWFGIVQLLLCLPLHLMLGRDASVTHVPHAVPERSHTLAEALRHPAFWKLAMAFAANMFIFSALSVHLIPLLKDFGHTAGLAVMMSTLIGPMQVAGRICERTFARNALPQTVGLFSFASLPAAVLALLLWGSQSWAAAAFCTLYGLSNGVLTIVRGTIPQAMFGRQNYGAISGAMAGPSLLAKAAGPLVAAFMLQTYPAPAVLIAMLLVSPLATSNSPTLGRVKFPQAGQSDCSLIDRSRVIF